MFKQQDEQIEGKCVAVVLDGEKKHLPVGVSVAAGLLAIGELVSRISPSSHKPCSPNCLMGVCYECLMEINGMQRQACLVEAQDGMVINRWQEDRKGEGHESLL